MWLRPVQGERRRHRGDVLAQAGWLGVDMFFVLSGFLITGILLDTRLNKNYWSSFYKRRVLRILPLYYFVVTVTWLTVIFIEKTPERLHGYDSFAWFFTFTPNIAISLKTMALGQNAWHSHSNVFNLNHLWSLAVEEQFYLVWPLCAMLGIGVVAGVWANFLTVLRYVGAVILVLMGAQLIRRAEAAGLAELANPL